MRRRIAVAHTYDPRGSLDRNLHLHRRTLAGDNVPAVHVDNRETYESNVVSVGVQLLAERPVDGGADGDGVVGGEDHRARETLAGAAVRNRLELAGHILNRPLRVPAPLHVALADRLPVEEELDGGAVGEGPDAHKCWRSRRTARLRPTSLRAASLPITATRRAPVPMRQQVEHRPLVRIEPDALVVIVEILWEAADVDGPKVRIDVGPAVRRRLALVVESAPYEPAGDIVARGDTAPRVLRTVPPRGVVLVIRGHVAAPGVVLVDGAVREGRARLAADDRLLRMRQVVAPVELRVIIDPHQREDTREVAIVPAVDRCAHGASTERIECVDLALEARGDRRLLGRLEASAEHLVANGPDEDRRVIAVAPDHRA